MSLLSEFLNLFETKEDGLHFINSEMNLSIKNTRMYEWLNPNNTRKLPAHIADFIRPYVLAEILKQEGLCLPPKTVKRIAKRLATL